MYILLKNGSLLKMQSDAFHLLRITYVTRPEPNDKQKQFWFVKILKPHKQHIVFLNVEKSNFMPYNALHPNFNNIYKNKNQQTRTKVSDRAISILNGNILIFCMLIFTVILTKVENFNAGFSSITACSEYAH